VKLAICMGGSIGEMDSATARCSASAAEGETWALRHSSLVWCDMAARLVELGEEDASAADPERR